MRIPVFVSCPTSLNPDQEKSRKVILQEMDNLQLEPRALGRSDYPAEYPLREVYTIAKHCAGAVILGFSQFECQGGKWKAGTPAERSVNGRAVFPTPWNNLEAGILYTLKLPIIVFHEDGISGGIFDVGATDLFINNMPVAPLKPDQKDSLHEVFLKWSSKVRRFYYGET